MGASAETWAVGRRELLGLVFRGWGFGGAVLAQEFAGVLVSDGLTPRYEPSLARSGWDYDQVDEATHGVLRWAVVQIMVPSWVP